MKEKENKSQNKKIKEYLREIERYHGLEEKLSDYDILMEENKRL